jgi:hypothetical protein
MRKISARSLTTNIQILVDKVTPLTDRLSDGARSGLGLAPNVVVHVEVMFGRPRHDP